MAMKVTYDVANYILTNAQAANSVFIINNDIDLETKQINLADGMTLIILGGSISNGTLRGSNTLLLGNWSDKITATLSGTFLNKGTTSQRPTSRLYSGLMFFDETLGKPIWWNGTAWVDATGTSV